MSSDPVEALVAGDPGAPPILLVRGERALAEPLAERLSARLAEAWQTEPVRLRHPGDLPAVVDDLRTYSLFSGGKLVIAVETGVFADKAAAADLLAEARAELPFQGGVDQLVGKARGAALRLLQVLRLFDVDPADGEPEQVLAKLPDSLWARGRGKGKRSGDDEREALAPLLAAAVEAGLRGVGEVDASILADLLRDGLPERHALILVESAAADEHPLVEALARRGAVVEAGRLSLERGGRVGGLDRLFAELERETGTGIRREAAEELARRTLRAPGRRAQGATGEVDSDSTERLGAEFRKLSALSGGSPISLELVREQVEDRGEEDVWELLDAVGAGRGGEALGRLARKLAGAEDPVAERLATFGMLAAFARQMAAMPGILAATGVRPGETSYPRFKSNLAPRLQGAIDGLGNNPLAGVHPFRLHRAYLAGGRLDPARAALLPALVLETELRLKGEGGAPDAALADLMLALGGSAFRPASRGGGGSRTRA